MKSYIPVLLLLVITTGCKKYLDEKPDKRLQLPNSIEAVQGLLDFDYTMNTQNPSAGEISADNYYVTDAVYNALSSQAIRNTYLWQDDITVNESPNHWSRLFDVVTVANVCLESLQKIEPTAQNQAAWNNAKGSAFLFRAKSWLTAIGYWTKAYDKNTATTEMGIPLRMNSDYEMKSTRASLQHSYEQVISDLKESAPLLPLYPAHVMRPSKGAAYGLLARTYLLMNNYDSAAVYADKYLAINSTLLNYNTLSSAAAYPFPVYNAEVSMHSIIFTPTILSITRAIVDSNLYRSYDVNDLRKTLFFKSLGNGNYSFRGSYNQASSFFNGVATDEIYLIKSECLARSGKLSEGLTVLNTLLQTRWKTGTFIPFSVAGTVPVLQLILNERRKELPFRDLRWMDIKRLNLEPDFRVTITRKLNGVVYTLPPGDNRFALPIPASAIALNGMQQNPR
ncbi:RagB/SusD family nutrient uptake outer membrane protein [Ferruginibacter sp.]